MTMIKGEQFGMADLFAYCGDYPTRKPRTGREHVSFPMMLYTSLQSASCPYNRQLALPHGILCNIYVETHRLFWLNTKRAADESVSAGRLSH